MKQGALIVGCGTFPDLGISALQFCSKDAYRFAETLQKFCGLPFADSAVLSDEAKEPLELPTRNNIVRLIGQIERKCKNERIDRIFLFMSGHGIFSPETGDLHFVCRDTYREDFEETSISIDRILKRLRNSGTREILVFLDTCRSNLAGSRSAVTDIANTYKLDLQGVGNLIAFGCQPGYQSFEEKDLESGLFTHSLVEALSDVGRCCTVGDVIKFIERRVPELSRAHSKRPLQRPYIILENPSFAEAIIVDRQTEIRRRHSSLVAQEIRTPIKAGLAPEIPTTLVCGVDFGSSKSVAAFYNLNKTSIVLLPSVDRTPLIKSALFIDAALQYKAGIAAYNSYGIDPQAYVQDFKRAIGTSRSWSFHNLTLGPTLLAAMLLASIRRNASEYLACDCKDVVVSFPVEFSLRQVAELKAAFHIAGFKIIRAISEAAAATLAICEPGSDNNFGNVLVIDMGGGTFDVAVASMGDQVVEIVLISGDAELGGQDIDDQLTQLINSKIEVANSEAHGTYILDRCRQYDRQIEAIKVHLNEEQTAYYEIPDVIAVDGNSVSIRIEITSTDFENILIPYLDRIKDILVTAIKQFNSQRGEDFDWVVFAGQGCKLKPLRTLMAQILPDVPIIDKYQENAVIRGVTYQAGVLSGSLRSILLLDVFHWIIGIYSSGSRDVRFEVASPIFAISGTSQNLTFAPLFQDRDTTIPAKRMFRIILEDCEKRKVLVPIGELHGRSEEFMQWGTLIFDLLRTSEKIWRLTIDVDANADVDLIVRSEETPSIEYTFRLLFISPILHEAEYADNGEVVSFIPSISSG